MRSRTLIRGRRGGISCKNFTGYIKFRKKFVPLFPVQPPDLHKRNSEAYAEYLYVEEMNERRDYYQSRGYDPDDPDVDIDMQLDNE